MWLLSGVAVILGFVGGGAAVGLFKLIGLLTHLTLLHDVGTSLPTLRGYHPSGWIVLTAIAGAIIVSLFALWAPVIRGHGIPESLEAILTRDSKIRPRAAIAKPLSAAVTIGTGGPFGAEGPIIVTGGSVGSLIGQVLSVSPAERRIMLATGAAAGMSATFNAPVASVILAIELILFERSLRTLVPLSIACGIAAAIHIVAFGSMPLFAVAANLHVSLAQLPIFAVVGLASGVLAVVLNKGLFAVEAGFRKLPVNIFWWPAIGALCFSVIGLFEPRTLSMGYSAIVDTLNGRFTVTAVVVLFVAKLISWWISLGSQTSGGTLAPMFLVGATMGSALGTGLQHLFPSWHVSVAACALVAMAAMFGSATKALLTSIVFCAEVTGQYHMFIPMMIGLAFAELVVEVFLTDRIMTEKLSHRGFRVDFRTETRVTRMRLARQVMHAPLYVPADGTVTDARRLLAEHGLTVLGVAGPGRRYLGLVTAPILDRAADDDPVGPLARSTIAPVNAGEYLASALGHFLASSAHALPVVDGDVIVGQLSRADIDDERDRYYSVVESRQPGWGEAVLARLRPGGSPRGAHQDLAEPGERRHATRGQALPVPAEPAADSTAALPTPPRAIASADRAVPAIVPDPVSLQPGPGEFTLADDTRIVVGWDSTAALPAAQELAGLLRPATGYRLPVVRGSGTGRDVTVTIATPQGLPESATAEGYQLDAGWSGLSVRAATPHGLHHGMQTIRHLLPPAIAGTRPHAGPWTIPGVHILDYPRYAYRGLCLDLSEHLLAPAEIMRLTDQLSAYKLDVLHLRLSMPQAFHIISDGVPGLQAAAAGQPEALLDPALRSWTRRQYSRIISHASARQVTVVPAVIMPRGDRPEDWMTYTAVTSRLVQLTPGLYYHVGPYPTPEQTDAEGRRGLAQFVTTQIGIVSGAGKVPIIGPRVYRLGAHVPPGSVLHCPQPAPGSSDDGIALDAVADGMRLIMSPGMRSDPARIGGVPQAAEGPTAASLSDYHEWDPTDDMPPSAQDGVLGVEAALRCRHGQSLHDVERLLYPRLMAAAEIAWSPADADGQRHAAYHDFVTRVADQGLRLAHAGIASQAPDDVPWRPELSASLPTVQHDEVSGTIAELAAPGMQPRAMAAYIDWGDGVTGPAELVPDARVDGSVWSVAGTHTYREAGSHTIGVRVVIDDVTALDTTVSVHTRRAPRGPVSGGTAPMRTRIGRAEVSRREPPVADPER